MKSLISAAMAFALIGSTAALAQSNNANPNAPGQDRTCLVTTGTADSWNDSDIVGTKWLPRAAAEEQAAKDPSTMRIFDYATDPLVENGTYESAEDLCNTHFSAASEDDEDDTSADGNGDSNSASEFAPGQQDGPAKDSAPGQQDGPAKDSAPGQVKKSQ